MGNRRYIANSAHLPNEISGQAAKVVRSRDMVVTEEIRLRVIGIITIPQEEFKEVEQTKPIHFWIAHCENVSVLSIRRLDM